MSALPSYHFEPADVEKIQDAEQELIGGLCTSHHAYIRVADKLRDYHFYDAFHQHVYGLVCEQYKRSGKMSIELIKQSLSNHPVWGEISPMKYIARMAVVGCSPSQAEGLAEVIITHWQCRQVISAGQVLREQLSSDGFISDHLSSAMRAIDEARKGADFDGRNAGEFARFADEVFDGITAFNQGVAQKVPSSGFADLDAQIGGGYCAGRLYVFAGRPGMGKTAFALSSVRRVLKQGYGVALFSLEIDGREIAARMLADEMAERGQPVAYRDIFAGRVIPFLAEQLADARDDMNKAAFRIEATPGVGMPEIEARASLIKTKFEQAGRSLDVVVIDYLGLVRAESTYRSNRVQELGQITKAAKVMAKRLGVAVVLLSQINRSVESRDVKRPTMSDLRDSGEIEEDADCVGMLYRPYYYAVNDPAFADTSHARHADVVAKSIEEKNTLEVCLAKTRLGEPSTIKLWCSLATNTVKQGGGI